MEEEEKCWFADANQHEFASKNRWLTFGYCIVKDIPPSVKKNNKGDVRIIPEGNILHGYWTDGQVTEPLSYKEWEGDLHVDIRGLFSSKSEAQRYLFEQVLENFGDKYKKVT